MCLYPQLIENPKYKANKKNGGNIPAVPDERVKLVPIGCQKCIECRKQKARAWQIRITEDIKKHTNAKFVTLTFSNESFADLAEEILNMPNRENYPTGYQLDNEIATLAVRRFLERYRKKHKKSIRHWLVTELGHQGSENIHLHGLLYTNDITEAIKHWKYGYVWAGYELENGELQNYVNEKTVTYITKYVTKADPDHKGYTPIILTSAGIGGNYQNSPDFKKHKYKGSQTKEYYQTRTGHKISQPIYYRNKLYTEEEREKLWLQRLDKQERFVLGNRVDISQGEEEYFRALEYAQQQNKELGFEVKLTWEQQEYERERRILKQKERIARANKNKKKK